MDRISDKIRKLLALAADPSCQGAEAETAARQAAKLMAKHQLDEADIQLKGPAGKLVFDLMEGYGRGTRPGKKNAKEVPTWIGIISWGVKIYTRTYNSLGSDRVYFKGQRCDVELAIWMHDTIVDQCYNASKAACAGMGMREASQWRNGYAGAVQSRLKQMAQDRNTVDQGEVSTGGTSLAVVNTALQQAMFERWGQGDGSKKSHVSMNDRGRAAGLSAALPTNRPISGAGSLRLK